MSAASSRPATVAQSAPPGTLFVGADGAKIREELRQDSVEEVMADWQSRSLLPPSSTLLRLDVADVVALIERAREDERQDSPFFKLASLVDGVTTKDMTKRSAELKLMCRSAASRGPSKKGKRNDFMLAEVAMGNVAVHPKEGLLGARIVKWTSVGESPSHTDERVQKDQHDRNETQWRHVPRTGLLEGLAALCRYDVECKLPTSGLDYTEEAWNAVTLESRVMWDLLGFHSHLMEYESKLSLSNSVVTFARPNTLKSRIVLSDHQLRSVLIFGHKYAQARVADRMDLLSKVDTGALCADNVGVGKTVTAIGCVLVCIKLAGLLREEEQQAGCQSGLWDAPSAIFVPPGVMFTQWLGELLGFARFEMGDRKLANITPQASTPALYNLWSGSFYDKASRCPDQNDMLSWTATKDVILLPTSAYRLDVRGDKVGAGAQTRFMRNLFLASDARWKRDNVQDGEGKFVLGVTVYDEVHRISPHPYDKTGKKRAARLPVKSPKKKNSKFVCEEKLLRAFTLGLSATPAGTDTHHIRRVSGFIGAVRFRLNGTPNRIAQKPEDDPIVQYAKAAWAIYGLSLSLQLALDWVERALNVLVRAWSHTQDPVDGAQAGMREVRRVLDILELPSATDLHSKVKEIGALRAAIATKRAALVDALRELSDWYTQDFKALPGTCWCKDSDLLRNASNVLKQWDSSVQCLCHARFYWAKRKPGEPLPEVFAFTVRVSDNPDHALIASPWDLRLTNLLESTLATAKHNAVPPHVTESVIKNLFRGELGDVISSTSLGDEEANEDSDHSDEEGELPDMPVADEDAKTWVWDSAAYKLTGVHAVLAAQPLVDQVRSVVGRFTNEAVKEKMKQAMRPDVEAKMKVHRSKKQQDVLGWTMSSAEALARKEDTERAVRTATGVAAWAVPGKPANVDLEKASVVTGSAFRLGEIKVLYEFFSKANDSTAKALLGVVSSAKVDFLAGYLLLLRLQGEGRLADGVELPSDKFPPAKLRLRCQNPDKPEEGEDKAIKVIVCCQHYVVMTIVANVLMQLKIDCTTILGDGRRVSSADLSPIDVWRKSRKPLHVLLLMGKDSTGLNLQEGEVLFVVELGGNEDINRQMAGRIYRQGQRKPTRIFRLVRTGGYDERLLEFQTSRGGAEAMTQCVARMDFTVFDTMQEALLRIAESTAWSDLMKVVFDLDSEAGQLYCKELVAELKREADQASQRATHVISGGDEEGGEREEIHGLPGVGPSSDDVEVGGSAAKRRRID